MGTPTRNRSELSSGLGHWARRGLLAVTLLMVAALTTTVWSSYHNVRSASETLVRGQGVTLSHALERALHDQGGPPSPQFLQELLAENAAAGLRYVGLFRPEGAPIASAGEPMTGWPEPEQELAAGPPLSTTTRGSRVRMFLHAERPPVPPGSGPPFGMDGEPPLRRPQPILVIEFEPLVANALERDATRTLGIGAATAVLLMIVSLFLLRWLLRREAMERQVERGRRLASLGEMSAVMAHEMRNPLASLKGHAQLLAESLAADSREHAKAELVVGESERLERLSTDLLEFVRSGEIEREPCDPAALLREAAAAVDQDRLELSTERAPAWWRLDGERMHQVLTNLLRNALQASPDGARPVASVEADGKTLVYRVRDHGDGIPRAERERIFEPFHTTRTRGTGLGLAVARRIVELHGGTIEASDHPDGGALFRVTIPEE